MFTGVIHHIGTIAACEKSGDWRITVASDLGEARIGDSIACNGCCLTVISCHPAAGLDPALKNNQTPQQVRGDNMLVFSLSQETLNCTVPRWDMGAKLHLERAMRMGDTLDGHMVSGHVDGLATIVSITPDADSHRLELEAPAELSRFIAAKGSVTLDGVSLTVNEVNGNRFTVNIIPHTWQVTTFHERKSGDKLNLEIDLIARYVQRLLGK